MKLFATDSGEQERTRDWDAAIALMEGRRLVGLCACPGVTNSGVAALAGLPRLRLGGMQNVTPEGAAAFPAHVRVSYWP